MPTVKNSILALVGLIAAAAFISQTGGTAEWLPLDARSATEVVEWWEPLPFWKKWVLGFAAVLIAIATVAFAFRILALLFVGVEAAITSVVIVFTKLLLPLLLIGAGMAIWYFWTDITSTAAQDRLRMVWVFLQPYTLLIAAALAILAFFASSGSNWRGGLGAAAAILLLVALGPGVVEWWNTPSAPRAPVQTAQPVQRGDPFCNERKTSFRYGTEPRLVSENAQCASALWYSGHCIYAKQAGNEKRLGPFCDKPGRTEVLPVDIEYAWSSGEPFDGYVLLTGKHVTQFFR